MDSLAPSKSLVQLAYEAILNEICIGALAPGTRLSQEELAERLNVSRQPVNSAIAMLKSQKFVKETGRRGVVVAPVDSKLFDAIYQFRSAIEPLAVELAAERLTKEGIALGRDIIARGKRYVQAEDVQAVLQADMEFHSLLYQLSANPIIIDTMHVNWRHLQRSMSRVLRFPGISVQVWKEHKQIFEELVLGNVSNAITLMCKHIKETPGRISASTT